jgi:hypothetical protein
MGNINYDKWTVDSAARKARHESGLYIEFNGSPSSSNFSGNPKNIPDGLAALEQVRLIRHGFEAYRETFEDESPAFTAKKSSTTYTSASSQDRQFSVKAIEGAPASKTKITIKKRRRIVLNPQDS